MRHLRRRLWLGTSPHVFAESALHRKQGAHRPGSRPPEQFPAFGFQPRIWRKEFESAKPGDRNIRTGELRDFSRGLAVGTFCSRSLLPAAGNRGAFSDADDRRRDLRLEPRAADLGRFRPQLLANSLGSNAFATRSGTLPTPSRLGISMASSAAWRKPQLTKTGRCGCGPTAWPSAGAGTFYLLFPDVHLRRARRGHLFPPSLALREEEREPRR